MLIHDATDTVAESVYDDGFSAGPNLGIDVCLDLLRSMIADVQRADVSPFQNMLAQGRDLGVISPALSLCMDPYDFFLLPAKELDCSLLRLSRSQATKSTPSKDPQSSKQAELQGKFHQEGMPALNLHLRGIDRARASDSPSRHGAFAFCARERWAYRK